MLNSCKNIVRGFQHTSIRMGSVSWKVEKSKVYQIETNTKKLDNAEGKLIAARNRSNLISIEQKSIEQRSTNNLLFYIIAPARNIAPNTAASSILIPIITTKMTTR